MAKILIAEDDTSLGMSLQFTLESEKHVVELVADGLEALDRLKLYPYELVILDVDLPGLSGFEVARQFRDCRGAIPILMLTGKTTINDKASGFDAGADDYLTKPFDMRELLMRINALLRRPSVYAGNVIEGRGISLDTSTRIAHKGSDKIELTAKEFELLEFLMKRPDQFIYACFTIFYSIYSTKREATPGELPLGEIISQKCCIDSALALIQSRYPPVLRIRKSSVWLSPRRRPPWHI